MGFEGGQKDFLYESTFFLCKTSNQTKSDLFVHCQVITSTGYIKKLSQRTLHVDQV